jgi:hypothetical protein
MAQQIFTGHNCCKDVKYPKRNLTITPRLTQLKPGEKVDLKATRAHHLCDPCCYTWELVAGTGRLPIREGINVTYWAPDTNEKCEGNAHIRLICGGEPIASAYVTTGKLFPGAWAYTVYQKKPELTWLPPPDPWPPPDLPPPPPQDKPPTGTKFADNVAFPIDWKPGDALPTGVTVDLNELIPDDWQPGDIPPDGLRIPPGTPFPPGWKKGDPLPEEVTVSTLTLFPPNWKAHISSNMIRFNYPESTFGCADDLIFKNPGPIQTWFWVFNHKTNKWQLNPPTGTALGGPYTRLDQIPWDKFRKDYPKTIDLRSSTLIKAGCCPAGLVGISYFTEEEET